MHTHRISVSLVLAATATLSFAAQRGGDDAAGAAGAYFGMADWNADGHVSFKEAQQSMGLDRQAFATFDTDRDGRIQLNEFVARYTTIVERGGVFLAPTPKPESKAPDTQSPEQLLALYDEDKDGGLSESELVRFVADSKNRDLDPATLLSSFDRDASKRLENAELAEMKAKLDSKASSADTSSKKTLADLFETRTPREAKTAAGREPARIAGPARDFVRLDEDGDGAITVKDLLELQRPTTMPVRPQAILSTIDTDGDGRITPAELEASMR